MLQYTERFAGHHGATISTSPEVEGLHNAVSNAVRLFDDFGPQGDAAMQALKQLASPALGIPAEAVGIAVCDGVVELVDKEVDTQNTGARFFASPSFEHTNSIYKCHIDPEQARVMVKGDKQVIDNFRLITSYI